MSGPDFNLQNVENLLRMRVHFNKDNSGNIGNLKKEGEALGADNALGKVVVLQQIRSGGMPEN